MGSLVNTTAKPNNPGAIDFNSVRLVADLLKYQTTVEDVETATGMKFKVK